MKVLITGANGLVGRNLKDRCPEGVQLLTPSSKTLNLLDFTTTQKYILDNQPDLVIHAAGVVGGIQANIANPIKFLAENNQIGHNLITSCYQGNIKKFINLGSSCIYPKDANNPLTEDKILKGELEPTNEGYALAKIYALRYCEYIKREDPSFNYKTIIPCNLYGKWDKFGEKNSHMIPAVIKKIDKAVQNDEESVEIWGSGLARREFMYAGDLADSIWYCVANFDKMPDLMNVGLGFDYSINEYYQEIANIVGFKGSFTHDLSKPEGMKQKLVDIQRLEQLGWKPSFSLNEGIKETYKYYKSISND